MSSDGHSKDALAQSDFHVPAIHGSEQRKREFINVSENRTLMRACAILLLRLIKLDLHVEVETGIEPVYTVLQTVA